MSDSATDTLRATIGDNANIMLQYEGLNASLFEYLEYEHFNIVKESAALSAEWNDIKTIPVDSEDMEKRLTDLGVRMNKFLKSTDLQRKIDKKIPSDGPEIVERFFRGVSTGIASSFDSLKRSINSYKDAKVSEERRKRDEERRAAAAAQAEAERLAREQAEAKRIAEEVAAAADTPPAAVEPAKPTYEELQLADAQRKATEAMAQVEAHRPINTTTSTDSGAKSLQIARWTGEIEDVDSLDLEALRPFLGHADLEKAVRAYVARYADTKPLQGARIFQKTSTSFRK